MSRHTEPTTSSDKDTSDNMDTWTRFDDLLAAIGQSMKFLIVLAVVMFFAGYFLTMYPAPSCAALQLVGLCK